MPDSDRRSSAMLPALLLSDDTPNPNWEPTSGAKAGGAAPYEISKTEPKLAQGGKATASLTITAKGGWHVNPDAPITGVSHLARRADDEQGETDAK